MGRFLDLNPRSPLFQVGDSFLISHLSSLIHRLFIPSMNYLADTQLFLSTVDDPAQEHVSDYGDVSAKKKTQRVLMKIPVKVCDELLGRGNNHGVRPSTASLLLYSWEEQSVADSA